MTKVDTPLHFIDHQSFFELRNKPGGFWVIQAWTKELDLPSDYAEQVTKIFNALLSGKKITIEADDQPLSHIEKLEKELKELKCNT